MCIRLAGIFLLIVLCLLPAIPLHAHGAPNHNNGFELKTNSRNNGHIRIMRCPLWACATENPPGTPTNDQTHKATFEISAHRLLMLAGARLLLQFGKEDKIGLQPFFAYSRKSPHTLTTGGNSWKIDGQRGGLIVQSQTFL